MSDKTLAMQWLDCEIKFTNSQQVGAFITKLATESIEIRKDTLYEALNAARLVHPEYEGRRALKSAQTMKEEIVETIDNLIEKS